MDDIINKVKVTATKAIDEAEKIRKTAVKKTKDVIDKTKYNYSISELENRCNVILSELGMTIYKEFENGTEFSQELQNKCLQIEKLKKDIEDMRAKVAKISNQSVCPDCGELVRDGAVFCSKCGYKFN